MQKKRCGKGGRKFRPARESQRSSPAEKSAINNPKRKKNTKVHCQKTGTLEKKERAIGGKKRPILSGVGELWRKRERKEPRRWGVSEDIRGSLTERKVTLPGKVCYKKGVFPLKKKGNHKKKCSG